MRKIYFDQKFICVCTSKSHSLDDPNAILYFPSDLCENYSDIVNAMLENDNESNFYIASTNQAKVYENLKTNFTEINAAGGLVRNSDGEYLLIYRNGFWDLPKGKQELYEMIENCALREVEEECGISDLKLGEQICMTDHTYTRDGLLMLKHTYWFYMDYAGNSELKPQTEEGISKAKWVNKFDLAPYLKNTYPTIIEVFKATI